MLSPAVILVGGYGTRLRPLTYQTPKAMMPVLGRPFLEHSLAYLKAHGVTSAVLTLSYLPEAIQEVLNDGTAMGMTLSYTVEEEPLGTAGAVKNSEAHLDGTFAVFNGDIFTDLDLGKMLAYHREKEAKVTIALSYVDNPCAFGVVETTDDGRVTRFIEKPPPDQITSHWINAGVYIIEPEVLNHVPENSRYSFERELFPKLLDMDTAVYGYPFQGYWLDMGTPEKYLRLNCDLLLAKATSHLIPQVNHPDISGPRAEIHPSAKITGPVTIGKGCRIGEKAQIQGPAVIGEGCYIGPGTILEQTVVWKGARLEPGAKLKQCVVSYHEPTDDTQIISLDS